MVVASPGYQMAMAFNCRELSAPRAEVFAVLADATTYPEWLVGAAHVRDVEGAYPSPGSRFHHTVGVRPLALRDITEVIDVEPDERLVLVVKARPLITAEVTFRLVGDGDRCVVCVEEEPTLRILGNLVRPLLDPSIHHRNHRSLRNLERVVLERRDDVRAKG